MADSTFIIRGAKETSAYLNKISHTVPTEIGKTMSRLAFVIKQKARAYVIEAMSNQPGSTGNLAASIATRRVDAVGNTRAWRVFVEGDTARYAAEIESRENISSGQLRTIDGPIRQWINRVQTATGRPVPRASRRKIWVGRGLHPDSIYARYPQGVRFMERATSETMVMGGPEIVTAARRGFSR